jgi:hypothetical protein
MRGARSALIVTTLALLTACASEPGSSTSPTSLTSPTDPTTSLIGDGMGPDSVVSGGDVRSTASEFVETFDGNVGLDRFDTGIYHRDSVLIAQTTWSGDHDADCGSPDTQRAIDREALDESFYLCRDHLMTSIGDTSGYSTGWFSPKQTFAGATEVSWDVNVTDLGARQWWEVAIMPSSFRTDVDECPHCSVVDWLSPDPSGLPAYPVDAVVVGNGPFGGSFSVHANGETFNPSDWQKACGDEWALGGDACSSKATRLPFTIRDNLDGTLTLTAFGDEFSFQGSFPDGEVNVVFKDHNYTPDKDGVPVGHTWHWDNIIVR